jgi:hypothetical protein
VSGRDGVGLAIPDVHDGGSLAGNESARTISIQSNGAQWSILTALTDVIVCSSRSTAAADSRESKARAEAAGTAKFLEDEPYRCVAHRFTLHQLVSRDLAPIRRSRTDFLHVAKPTNPLAADATTATTCHCKFRCLGSAPNSPRKPINDHLKPYNLKRLLQTESPTGRETTVFAEEFAGSQFALQEGKRVS